MEELLARLQQVIGENPNRAFFNAPASNEQITQIVAAIGRPIPSSLRLFLEAYNGGFISIAGESSDPDWDMETAAWNSNVLLSTDQIIAEHGSLRLAVLGKRSKKLFPCLPFCHTESQALLVIAAESDEPAVLDAFHEDDPEDWDVLYADFPSFLAAYLEGMGSVEQVAE